MPTYIPTVNELQEAFDLAQDQSLLDLPGKDLFDRFFGKNGHLPPEHPLPPSPELRANPRSWLLTLILVMTRPGDAWDANEAQNEFKKIAGELCAAWDAQAHNNQQKLRKTADHAVVFGVRNGWQSSLDILYWLIQEPVKASLRFVNILIPGLTACWEYPIRDDAPLIATLIRDRMLNTFKTFRLDAGDALQFISREEHLEISPNLETVLAGCRRNFRVQSGKAILSGPEEFNYAVLPSQRLMIRGLDEGRAEIQVAHFVPGPHGGAIGGRRCSLDIGQTALLTATEPSDIEAWSCTCGTWRCDERHRLSAWNPAALPPNASLRTFIWTAVKGPGLGFHLEAFAANMIYPILCDGVGMKRIRFVLLLSCSEAETEDGLTVACCTLHPALVPFTNVCNPEMVRARKCRCQCWAEEISGVAICAACGTLVNRGRATRCWKRRDNKEIPLDKKHERIPDAIENPEAYLIAKEQQDYEPDWENQND